MPTPARSTAGPILTLVGESQREVAVLVAVFAPLDFLAQGKALTAPFLLLTIAGVAVLFTVGVFLEVKWGWTR